MAQKPVKVFYLNQHPESVKPAILTSNKNLELHTFSNGLDLYQHLKSGHLTEVLLLELNSSAFDCIRLLQQDPPLKKTPIILICPELKPELLEKASYLGLDDVFATAQLNHHFLARLHYLVKKYRLLNNRPENPSLQEAIHSDLERLTDVTFSALALLISLPFLALVALLIKLSGKGPVFEVTQRIGRNNQIFEFYKFRTSNINGTTLANDDHIQEPEKLVAVNFFEQLSYWLRINRLDELPKLFNILRGDIMVAGALQPLYRTSDLQPEEYRLRFAAPVKSTVHSQVIASTFKTQLTQVGVDLAAGVQEQEKNFRINLKLIFKNLPAAVLKKKAMLSQANTATEEHQVAYS